jgi:hypothetical protein
MRRADAERPDSNAVDPVGVEGGLDDRCRLARVEPPRPEQQHARVRQPPKREPERARRRGVEPLEIVDRHDEPVVGEQLQGVADRDPERPRIDRTAVGVLDQERDLECPALRRRERGQHVVEHSVEKIAEAGVRKAALRLGRARGEQRNATPAREPPDGGAPECDFRSPPRLERDRDRSWRPAADRETRTET